jgi:hypothetical protein
MRPLIKFFNSNAANLISLSTLSLALVACGGGGSGSDTSNTSLTGTFIDNFVSGINYQTDTLSGTTNSTGEFQYLAGESVIFSIGDINLPSVPAGTTITPTDMVSNGTTTNSTVLNIARLLQSLDEDGNPSNGIQISTTAHTAATGITNIDFSSANFESNAEIINLVANSGSVNTTLVSAEAAAAHLQATISSISIAGSWSADLAGNHVLFTFLADGTYLHTEDGSTDPNGQDGMERGTYTWDRNSGSFSSSCPAVDTNGEYGLSHQSGQSCTGTSTTIRVNGDTLTIDSNGSPFQLSRVFNINNSIVGSWHTNSAGYDTFITFDQNGNYTHAEDGNTDPNGMNGMERGTYTWNQNTGDFNSSCPPVDTNGQWGLSHPNSAVCTGTSTIITVNGNTLTINPNGTPFNLYRVNP